MPFANFIPKILNLDTSAYMLGWGVAPSTRSTRCSRWCAPRPTGADGSFNLGGISDPKLDNTIDAIKIATDPKARDALIARGAEHDARRGTTTCRCTTSCGPGR